MHNLMEKGLMKAAWLKKPMGGGEREKEIF